MIHMSDTLKKKGGGGISGDIKWVRYAGDEHNLWNTDIYHILTQLIIITFSMCKS
jgi:hypothetical protein